MVVDADFENEILVVTVVDVNFIKFLGGKQHKNGGVGCFLMEIGGFRIDSQPPFVVFDIVSSKDGDIEVA